MLEGMSLQAASLRSTNKQITTKLHSSMVNIPYVPSKIQIQVSRLSVEVQDVKPVIEL